MKQIEISEKDYKELEWLAANYVVVKGDTPMPLTDLVHRLIERMARAAHPEPLYGSRPG